MLKTISIITAIAALMLSSNFALSGEIEDEILAEAHRYADAWNRGDIDAINATHDPSYIVVSSTDGPSNLQERLANVSVRLSGGQDRGVLSFHDITVRPLGDNYVLAYGRAHLLFEDGSDTGGWFTSVYVKTADGWIAIHDHG